MEKSVDDIIKELNDSIANNEHEIEELTKNRESLK